jgi:hypothetical protein
MVYIMIHAYLMWLLMIGELVNVFYWCNSIMLTNTVGGCWLLSEQRCSGWSSRCTAYSATPHTQSTRIYIEERVCMHAKMDCDISC